MLFNVSIWEMFFLYIPYDVSLVFLLLFFLVFFFNSFFLNLLPVFSLESFAAFALHTQWKVARNRAGVE